MRANRISHRNRSKKDLMELHGNTVHIFILVSAGVKQTKIVGWHANRLKVHLAAPPDKGKANDALLSLIAQRLEVSPSDLSLIQGKTTRHKTLCIANTTIEAIAKKLPPKPTQDLYN